MCGLIGAAFSTPADLLKVRMQAWEHPVAHNIFWHSRDIYQHLGLRGFFQGVAPTLLRAGVLNATYLPTYDHTKHFLINNNIIKDGYLNHFVSSVFCGIVLAIVASPFDFVKTRIQN